MNGIDWAAAGAGALAQWRIWSAASIASRRIGDVQMLVGKGSAAGMPNSTRSWRRMHGRNVLVAAMTGLGMVLMQRMDNLTILQALGLWGILMLLPAAYKLREGSGPNERIVGIIRAIGLLAATLGCVVVVYLVGGYAAA